jgi:hypothetical protein
MVHSFIIIFRVSCSVLEQALILNEPGFVSVHDPEAEAGLEVVQPDQVALEVDLHRVNFTNRYCRKLRSKLNKDQTCVRTYARTQANKMVF